MDDWLVCGRRRVRFLHSWALNEAWVCHAYERDSRLINSHDSHLVNIHDSRYIQIHASRLIHICGVWVVIRVRVRAWVCIPGCVCVYVSSRTALYLRTTALRLSKKCKIFVKKDVYTSTRWRCARVLTTRLLTQAHGHKTPTHTQIFTPTYKQDPLHTHLLPSIFSGSSLPCTTSKNVWFFFHY